MTKLATLARAASGPTAALFLFTLVAVTAGCGSSGSDTPQAAVNPPPPPPVETIEGVATPSSVAVVTATNAQ